MKQTYNSNKMAIINIYQYFKCEWIKFFKNIVYICCLQRLTLALKTHRVLKGWKKMLHANF